MARGRIGGGPAHSKGRGRGRGRLAPHGGGSQATRAVSAQAGLEFDPAIREGRQQAQGSRKREQDLGSWYQQLAADYAQSQQAGQQAFETAQNTTSKQLDEAAARSQGEQAELTKQDAEFAKTVGGPTNEVGLSTIAKAAAAADRSRVALNAPVAQTQANYLASLGGRRTAARMRGVEAQKEERSRRDKIRSDIGKLRKEKGAAKVVGAQKQSEAARDAATELAKLQLDRREAATAEQKATADTALARLKASHELSQDAIGNRQSQERIGISRRNSKTSARSQRATAKHYKQSGKGGLSPGERNTNRKERQSAASLVHTAVTQAGPPHNAAEAAELESIVVEKGGSPREVHRAVQTLLNRAKAKSRKGYANRAAAERAGKAAHR